MVNEPLVPVNSLSMLASALPPSLRGGFLDLFATKVSAVSATTRAA